MNVTRKTTIKYEVSGPGHIEPHNGGLNAVAQEISSCDKTGTIEVRPVANKNDVVFYASIGNKALRPNEYGIIEIPAEYIGDDPLIVAFHETSIDDWARTALGI